MPCAGRSGRDPAQPGVDAPRDILLNITKQHAKQHSSPTTTDCEALIMAGSRGTPPLTTRVGRILRAHGEAERTGVPVADVLGRAEEAARSGPSRRDVLRASGVAGAGAALAMAAAPAHAAEAAKPGAAPRIAIVGAGLAGIA